ncbi:predicted protein [Aspergillus nidulans FGSC A4]|uniref:Uncharacterized protein n=1 Tax=Emericella nidulans (strain FGSC A4 / ATCC 38163 / CBS 112.46 / NRRL 194 / M139) TaxID=227321 RepID=Q5AZC2_EMENI|nr:hypothetical protein [Aspergillus nidulans FGSC A4]EAA58742.1 predicted protein [Aspergillus nidulans FGSC A4]CBF69631.1 TPA: conserved hypothetical protein [Aspergillus nidulans FGSC A4]|eukprot:XP_663962.1 predicted protein [Aspergillus nidulans FGSC A4]
MSIPAIIDPFPEPQAAFQVRYAEPKTLECPRPRQQLDTSKLTEIHGRHVRFAPDTTEYMDRKPLRSSPFPTKANITRLDLTLTTANSDADLLPLQPARTPMRVRFAAEISIIPRPADSFDHVLSAVDFNTTHLDSTGKTCPVMQHVRFADEFTNHSHAHDVFPLIYVRDGERASVSSSRSSSSPSSLGARRADELERSSSLDNFVFVAENCRRRKRRFRRVCGKVKELFKERKGKVVL